MKFRTVGIYLALLTVTVALNMGCYGHRRGEVDVSIHGESEHHDHDHDHHDEDHH